MDGHRPRLHRSNPQGAGPLVNSAYFKKAMEDMRPVIVATPKIVSRQVEGGGWDEIGELKID